MELYFLEYVEDPKLTALRTKCRKQISKLSSSPKETKTANELAGYHAGLEDLIDTLEESFAIAGKFITLTVSLQENKKTKQPSFDKGYYQAILDGQKILTQFTAGL